MVSSTLVALVNVPVPPDGDTVAKILTGSVPAQTSLKMGNEAVGAAVTDTT